MSHSFPEHWKTDVSGEDAQSQEIFGVLLICVHAIMFIAILVQSYLAMQVYNALWTSFNVARNSIKHGRMKPRLLLPRFAIPLRVVPFSTLPMLRTTFLAVFLSRYPATFYKKAASGSRDELLRRLVTEESSIRRSDGFRSSGLRMRVHPRIADGPRRRGIIRGENMRINQRVISTHGDQLGGVAHLEMGNAR